MSHIYSGIRHIPILTTGQNFLHSWRHLLGLHLSLLTMAIRVKASFASSFLSFLFDIVDEFFFPERKKNDIKIGILFLSMVTDNTTDSARVNSQHTYRLSTCNFAPIRLPTVAATPLPKINCCR